MRTRRQLHPLAAAATAATVLALATVVPGATAATAVSCPDVQAVWARGSGQSLGGAEYVRFQDQLDARVDDSVDLDLYELGSDTVDGSSYPAVPVAPDAGWDSITNAIGAKFGSGRSFEYGDSVEEGVAELTAFLAERDGCTGTQLVLAGYSQGAQVVGQAYAALPDATKDRVVFNALFGDPKLYLPEGEGPWAPACKGQELSAWRRTVPDCNTDNGSLGARKPYLPSGYDDRTGLWCADDDFVCGSDKRAWVASGHGTYPAAGGAIDAAAQEIAGLLAEAMPSRADAFDVTLYPIRSGSTGLDVLFVIDSTGSMSGRIEAAKQFAATMAETVAASRGRVALVEYRDAGDDFVAVTRSGLTTDVAAFRAALDPISADGGGDTPEALLTALMTGFDELEWRPGATKAAVVLTDAEYHDPDVATGVTLAEVAARSLEIDPVNVYPVVPAWLAPNGYTALADQTSGQVIVDDGDTVGALADALTRVTERPVATLANTSYLARPGEEVRFDASGSYAIDSTITRYDWDVDGDGVFEQTTTEPVATHTYPAELTGQMQVRVTDANGLIGSMSVPVTITLTPPDDGLPAAPTSVTATPTTPVDGLSEVTVAWDGDPAGVAEWGVTVDGVPVARVPVTERSVVLTDVRRGEAVEIGVLGLTADTAVGDARTVVVPAAAAEPAPAGPGTTPGGPGTPAPGGPAGQAPARGSASPVTTPVDAAAAATPTSAVPPTSAGTRAAPVRATPADAARGGVLARTGLDVGAVAGAAMVLMIAGAAALVASHQRRLRAQR